MYKVSQSVFGLLFVLLHLANAQTVSPVSDVQLFPYGSDAGDLQGPLGDDSSSPPLTLTTPFTFFGKQHTEIIVNSNGVLSFGNERFLDFAPRRFPFESPPLVAPFWDDFNPHIGGNISYRQTNDSRSDQLDLFYNYTSCLMDCKDELNDCYPTHLFVATWDHVPPYYSFIGTREQNTFQVVLGTNGIATFAVFLYTDIQWGQGAQIGFNSGDGHSSFMLSEALTELTVDVDERSNVEKPGVYVFRIDDLGLVECFEMVECTNSTFKIGIMTAAECCLMNSNGLAYTTHGTEECHACVVFGWLQDSFTGVEQEDRHVIMAGYQKGAQSVGHNFTFTISERTSQYSFFGGSSPDLMVLTSEVRISPHLQPQGVEVIFQMDNIAQEGNVTVILELDPLPTTSLPMEEAVFFRRTIDVIIIDTDILDIYFTLDVYESSEADMEMILSVCKNKPIPWSYESDVRVIVASVTVENATTHEGLPIPDSDPYSPNRASREDFEISQHYMLFYGTINCLHSHIMISNDNINEANEEVFVIELKLDYSLDPSSIILTRNASLGVIIDDDPIRIGFERQNYSFTEPPIPLLRSFFIPLVKEGGQLSEQTFTVQIEVSNMTHPFEPATLGEDYNHYRFNVTFPPNQQTVEWEFELIPNEAPEENEAFRLILSSVGHPEFLTDNNDVINETLIIINDPQNLVGFIQDVYSVHENQGSISISVFSFNSSIDVEVNFTTFKLTAIEGEDYAQISEQISIAGNQTTVMSIPIIDDDLAEGVELFGGMLQVLSPQSNASSIITIEIIDDEDEGDCGNAVPSKGICSEDALCEVSANGRALLNCFCKDGFLGTGPICRNINECEIGQHNCHINADCVDTFGSYECHCKDGFFGDGQKCISATNRVSDTCDQIIGNCSCFNSSDGNIECGCSLGYELINQNNSFACQDVNECNVGNPCNSGACENTNGSYNCFCRVGYVFDPTGKQCVDLDECVLGLHNCDRNAFCSNNDGGFKCACKEDYFGNGTFCFHNMECKDKCSQRCIESTESSFCGCEKGYHLLSDLTTCEDINECKVKIFNCDENADCINNEGSYQCQCKAGFQGNGIICKDIDECDTGLHNCSLNANCSNTESSFDCICKESFFGDGKTCTVGFRPVILVANDTDQVLPNHQLSYSIGRNFCLEGNDTIPPHGATINCTLQQTPVPLPVFNMTMTRVFRNGAVEKRLDEHTPRLSLHASQLYSLFEEDTETLRISCYVSNSFGNDSRTTDIRMCGTFECQDGVTNNCTQVCTRNISSDGISAYECSCTAGYILNENDTNFCDDLDECVNSTYHNCSEAENELCLNTVGSFTCECLQGFDLNASTNVCEDINECTKMLHNCSEDEDCLNEPGGFSCNCSSSGFRKRDPWGLCEDIDECANDTLNDCSEDKHQLCVNTNSSFYCNCIEGFQWKAMACQDIDECSEGTGNCTQLCNNTDGSYLCYCQNGYTLDLTDNSTCLDNNECDGEFHRCHSNAICINTDGAYDCQCKSGYEGDGSIDCHLSTTLTVSSSLGLVSFLLVGGMVGAVVCICCYVRRYSKANKKNRIYLAQLTNVHKKGNEYGKFTIDRQGFSVQSSFKLNFSPHLIIKKANIKVSETIGQGEFGVVYKGHLIKDLGRTVTEVVAIKTLKGFFDRSAVKEMLKECSKMHHFNHANVLTLKGVCLDGGPAPYIIMPFMANGSLLAYLKKNRGTLVIPDKESNEMDNVSKQLTDMCIQVAKGMEYLASMKMVHRDLAARNCMIDINFVIKVADFGLSESVGPKEYFRQDKDSCIKLPLKWLAPESMEDGVFSEKSDVWAFGVTCWEIFSAGKSPYPGVNPSDLPKLLGRGQRLDKPNNEACHDEMYKFMLQCWKFEPDLRPCFSKLVTSLSKFLEDVAGYFDFGSISTFGKCDGFQDADLETNPGPVIFINETALVDD